MMKKNPTSTQGFFLYLVFLTFFFMLLEISFFIQCNRAYLSDFSFVTDNLHIPISVLPGILYFILAQSLIHFAYCSIVGILTYLTSQLLNLSSSKTLLMGISLWLLGIMSAVVANQYYFPNSKFSELSAILLVNHKITQFVLYLFLSMCAIIIMLSCLKLMQKLSTKSLIYFALLSGLIVVVGYASPKSKRSLNLVASSSRPNIILIGIDSLRPDYLSYFGQKKSTPFFDSFLEQAVVFNNAVTPLARTFPSWTSILSGLYPRQTGVRTNLSPQQHLELTQTLPAILRRQGYETIYATDETRFSNIGTQFGFDRIITPPIGLNDFLIGTFNDFPLSNLLINTVLGKWLFPYSYGNRPVHFAYDPDSFLKLLYPALVEERTKPLFLAVHFCLPHYPYLWSHLNGSDYDVRERYQASVQRVDQQVNDFYAQLKHYHLLDHAIVVLLSDHGEALELAGDRVTEAELFIPDRQHANNIPRFYPPSLDKEEVNQSVGHGTDVLGLTQYHTLLAFKLYGVGKWQHRLVPGVVSLLDIKPTILALLGEVSAEVSGESLAGVIKGDLKQMKHHNHIFLESDFSPEAIHTIYPETRKVLLDGVELFEIDPITTRLTVKDAMSQMIIRSKQYADIYDDWILALYPQADQSRMPILVNLITGEWTNDLQSQFAIQSPAKQMMEKLKMFYGKEIA